MAVAPVASDRVQRLLPPLSMAIPLTIVVIAVLAIPLATAQALEFTPHQTGAWILGLNAIPGVLSLLLSRVYRRPLFLDWNGFIIAFFASLVGQVRYTDLLGASLVGGAVAGLILTGVTGRFGTLPDAWSAPPLVITMLTFSLPAILTVVPVFAALTALQANLTAVVYLQSQGNPFQK
jgi:predicted benzoate:H+ symporter BenE